MICQSHICNSCLLTKRKNTGHKLFLLHSTDCPNPKSVKIVNCRGGNAPLYVNIGSDIRTASSPSWNFKQCRLSDREITGSMIFRDPKTWLYPLVHKKGRDIALNWCFNMMMVGMIKWGPRLEVKTWTEIQQSKDKYKLHTGVRIFPTTRRQWFKWLYEDDFWCDWKSICFCNYRIKSQIKNMLHNEETILKWYHKDDYWCN